LKTIRACANWLNKSLRLPAIRSRAANNGQVGLDYAIQGGFTAIICDLKMPIMDGMTFLTALQQHKPPSPNGPSSSIPILSTITPGMKLYAGAPPPLLPKTPSAPANWSRKLKKSLLKKRRLL
jgi:CheY-like chemotaxis protein